MVRKIVMYVVVVCCFISCKQNEVCCDVGVAGGTPWPSKITSSNVANYESASLNNNNTYNYSDNNNYTDDSSTQFNSTEVVDPYTDNIVAENDDFVTDNSNNSSEFITSDSSIDDFNENTVTNPVSEINNNAVSIAIEAPSKIYIGNEFRYDIKLKNETEQTVSDVRIAHVIPKSLQYVAANIIPEKNDDTMVWQIGEISPFAIRTFSITTKAINDGMAKLVADVESPSKQSATAYVLVDASTGININHSDLNDPVEVGDTTTYEIEIENQGNKKATNIKVVDIIPLESSFVEAHVDYTEEISYKFNDGKVVFDTIRSLEPQHKVSFQIIVKVEEVGDLLNSVEVSTDDFAKTITSQEGTKSFRE